MGLLDMLIAGRASIVNVASCAQWLAEPGPLAERLAVSVANPRAPPTPTAPATAARGTRPAGAGWSQYCDSKAANVAFTFGIARKYGAVLRAMAYHPGVMATDLWSHNGGGDGGDGGGGGGGGGGGVDDLDESTSDCLGVTRLGCALFVKHPAISGAGAAALAAPRCGWTDCRDAPDCCTCCCSSGNTTCGPFLGRCLSAALAGDGGYYQQGLCCCLVPVRARPALYEVGLQDMLWDASLEAVRAEAPELLVHAGTSSSGGGGGVTPREREREVHVSPALPCTELFSAAPNCVCFSCLC